MMNIDGYNCYFNSYALSPANTISMLKNQKKSNNKKAKKERFLKCVKESVRIDVEASFVSLFFSLTFAGVRLVCLDISRSP